MSESRMVWYQIERYAGPKQQWRQEDMITTAPRGVYTDDEARAKVGARAQAIFDEHGGRSHVRVRRFETTVTDVLALGPGDGSEKPPEGHA